jgi:hypothetical protein
MLLENCFDVGAGGQNLASLAAEYPLANSVEIPRANTCLVAQDREE